MTRLITKSFLIAALICLISPCLVIAKNTQPQIDDAKWARSYNGFALICRSLGLEPQPELSRWKRRAAGESILVIFGNPSRIRRLGIDVNQFIRDGGAVLVASDGGQPYPPLFPEKEVSFVRGSFKTKFSQDWFNGFEDCPVVSKFDQHPVVAGINGIATNGCGGIRVFNRQWQGIATMPERPNTARRYQFLVASSVDSKKRILLSADQSVFTNQMLFHMDNARLALQAMNWLKDGKRTNLLMLVDGKETNPENPQAVDVDFPPPTPDQVWDAIQNLPPDVLLAFGNEIATLVEDENLANEMMSMVFEDVSDTHMVRGSLFFVTLLLAGFVFYRYMGSESTVQEALGTDTQEIAKPGQGWLSKRRKAAGDRHVVAKELVTRFYNKVTGGKHDHYLAFPADLAFVNCENQDELVRGLKQTAKLLKWRTRRWWNQERLLGLRAQLDYWEHLYENNQLVYVPDTDLEIPNITIPPAAGPR